jgi:hypothetical protein
MTSIKHTLSILPEIFSICRLDKDSPIPDWALAGSFFSITRTAEELSVVCSQDQVPEGVKRDVGWRCLKIEGLLDLSATGLLASLTRPLAREKISIFVVSTYDTDYLLVKQKDLEKAVMVLSQNSHKVQRNSSEQKKKKLRTPS